MIMTTERDLQTIDAVLDLLTVTRPTLYRFIARQSFPLPLKIGGGNRWRADEVWEWLDARPRANIRVDDDPTP